MDNEKLICVVGGTGSVAVALHKDTGQEIWRALTASGPGYCPPTLIEAGGRKQLLIWDADKLHSLNPDSGQLFWSTPPKPAYGMSIAAPRQVQLQASGIGPVAVMLKLAGDEPDADIVWQAVDARTAVRCSNSTPLIMDDIIYGVGCHRGELAAVELRTGKRLWEKFDPTSGARPANQGTVFLVRHEDRCFLFNERGDLIMACLTPAGQQELGRFDVLEPANTTFGRPVVRRHPAFAQRCVFARNDEEIVCVDLGRVHVSRKGN